MNVKELIDELKELPEDTEVQLSVNYDNCWHIQEAEHVSYFKPGEWVTIIGKKGD